MILKQQSLQMSSAVVILAVIGFTEGFGLAEMISNYAKVTTNNGLKTNNMTDRYTPNATSYMPQTNTVLPETNLNETEYEDFDDLEASTENSISRQTLITPDKMFKYFNGLFSLLALMNNFSGSTAAHRGSKRGLGKDKGRGEHSAEVQGRYLPDTATKKFKYQTDQEQQPIGNYPPYNPLTANEAETYTKNGKTSYDADLQKPKKSPSMSEYMVQNHDPNRESHSYEITHSKPNGEWNAINQDYTDYKSGHGHMWGDSEGKNQWNTPEEHPVYHYSLPEKKPHDYHDLVLAEPPEDHHHHHHHHHLIEDEDRETKQPYSYYFLGRKLWYIPLIFSVYFILYIGALVLKSIARHKIQFPDKLWDLKDDHYKHRRYRKVDEITEMYDNAIDSAKNKFM